MSDTMRRFEQILYDGEKDVGLPGQAKDKLLEDIRNIIREEIKAMVPEIVKSILDEQSKRFDEALQTLAEPFSQEVSVSDNTSGVPITLEEAETLLQPVHLPQWQSTAISGVFLPTYYNTTLAGDMDLPLPTLTGVDENDDQA